MANLKLYTYYIIVYSLWMGIVSLVSIYLFDFFNTNYFRFGPSPDLYLLGTNVLIDTWTKYSFYSVYLCLDSFIVVFIGETILPWINASILNQDNKIITNNKINTFIFVNAMYILMVFRALFSIGAMLTQIDFFIYTNVGRLVAGSLTSGIAIYKKEYEKNEDDQEMFWV